eukprot:s5688_g6.t1
MGFKPLSWPWAVGGSGALQRRSLRSGGKRRRLEPRLCSGKRSGGYRLTDVAPCRQGSESSRVHGPLI